MWSVPRCYKRGKLGAAVSEEKSRRLGPGSYTVRTKSQLWDICQLVRTVAEDIVRIRYQEMHSEDIEDFKCAAVTVIFKVCKPVRLLYKVRSSSKVSDFFSQDWEQIDTCGLV
jgi:hypothetical protein